MERIVLEIKHLPMRHSYIESLTLFLKKPIKLSTHQHNKIDSPFGGIKLLPQMNLLPMNWQCVK